ncbi:MAG: radical SAM protein [Thermodesulfovibrionales bacterium]|nr:radical SAM protein [Thermodesulfovibrionales bacterium]
MGRCRLCNVTSPLISEELSVCLKCIRNNPAEGLSVAMNAHKRSRKRFGLPEAPPRDPAGIPCNLCVNECMIPEGELGYCGLRRNEKGSLTGVTKDEGKLSWYHDPLPTNCVGDWVCAGGTGSGYPRYAHSQGPEYGFNNLAVFFHACSFNCLYCQNWHFREETLSPETRKAEELLSSINSRTSCICYFGGDPAAQLPFAINASRLALENNKGMILRICWETNGSMNKALLKTMIDLSLQSGGCVKFDLKAWDENLHIALTGITNRRTLENFEEASRCIPLRPEPPPIIASTLLVPGYIDDREIKDISRFIASLNPEIPYSLLAFYPHFYMKDLPLVKKVDAYRYLKIAQEQGLKNVRIGNIHLLT